MRAILVASGRNIEGLGFQEDLDSSAHDGRDGAGRVDFWLAQQMAWHRRTTASAAEPLGWASGWIWSHSQDMVEAGEFAPAEYKIKVDQNQTVSVALTWTVPVGEGANPSRGLRRDHDLVVYDGSNPIAASRTWDSNVEYLEFEAIAGRTYRARIQSWFADSPRTWLSRYGIAWIRR